MKTMDRFTLAITLAGMISLVVVMWLGLKYMVDKPWYSWIDPTVISLLVIMVITGTLAVITHSPKEK